MLQTAFQPNAFQTNVLAFQIAVVPPPPPSPPIIFNAPPPFAGSTAAGSSGAVRVPVRVKFSGSDYPGYKPYPSGARKGHKKYPGWKKY